MTGLCSYFSAGVPTLSDHGAQLRLDEYAVRVTTWADGRFNLQPDHGGKLAGLKVEPPICPWRNANRVLVEPQLRAMIARLEAAIDPGLGKRVNGRAELRVDEQTEPRIKQGVARGEDEAGRWPAEIVRFEI